MVLNFNLANQTLTKDGEIDNLHIVADSKNYLIARFNFNTDEWKDRLVYALFTYNKQTYKMILGADARLQHNECFVPHEVIHAPGFTVSCYCDTGITTNVVQVKVAKSGYTENITNQQTTPSVMEQMGNYMKKYATVCNAILQDCQKIRNEIGGR
jgi:hypothetical protein